MRRIFGLVVCLCAMPAVRADELAPGSWQITSLAPNGAKEITQWVLKIDRADGKTTATVVTANPAFRKPAVKSFAIEGDTVRIVVSPGIGEQLFNGRIAKDGKKVVGTFGTADVPYPAWMVPTELTKLTLADTMKPAGDAGAGMAALYKLRTAKKDVATTDLADRAATASKDAVQYGPAWQTIANVTIANALAKHPGQAEQALKYALEAQQTLDAKASPVREVQVLEAIALAAQQAGKRDISEPAVAKVAKLDAMLDKEYLAQGLPFKPAAFAGRSADSKRAVVLELFTGAQCPPCVAADLAFDGLLGTYKPTDLVLLQYHVHIPGPDPLTNPDTEARWKYYQKAFTKVRGVPTAIVNGKKPTVGGGPRDNAEETYAIYCKSIDPLLETPPGCRLSARAVRAGDRIDIQAAVADLDNPGSDMKLRFVLVEDVVHYGGGNRIRMHHHVVRAMPGGVEGKAVMEKNMQIEAAVDVPELRKSLTSYLDDFVAAKGPFPRLIRPLQMHDLHLIALVQDDTTHEILQAVQVEVTAK